MRDLVREFKLNVTDFIYPLFIVEGKGIKREIPSLPEVYHFSIDQLETEIKEIKALGIRAVLLFGVPEYKDSQGSEAYNSDGIVQQAIQTIKSLEPELLVVTDVCMCQYTDHGHCGILDEDHEVDNDVTLEYLSRIAVSHAKAGADIIAPSDMMDGRIGALRKALDDNHKSKVAIMSYSVKYASNLYGPFRDAAHSAPSFGDRKTYQMDYHNRRDALVEADLDTEEGADMLMVKPASFYLDIISAIKHGSHLPIVAYQVSGEYTMLYNAVKQGVVNEQAIYEQLIAIKRAGADMIISYFSKYIAKQLEG
jgi:porphobilinogen synthase